MCQTNIQRANLISLNGSIWHSTSNKPRLMEVDPLQPRPQLMSFVARVLQGENGNAPAPSFFRTPETPQPSALHTPQPDQISKINLSKIQTTCSISISARLGVHSRRIPKKSFRNPSEPGQIALFSSRYRLAVDYISKAKYKTWSYLPGSRFGCFCFRKAEFKRGFGCL